MKKVLKRDVIGVCEALGFATCRKWSTERMAKKLVDIAELAGDPDADMAVEDEDLAAVLKQIVAANGEVEVVEDAALLEADEVPEAEEADEADEADEAEEDEDEAVEESEDEEDEEEDAAAEPEPAKLAKAKKVKKEKPAKPAKAKKEKPAKEPKAKKEKPVKEPKAKKESKVKKDVDSNVKVTYKGYGVEFKYANVQKIKLLVKENPHRQGSKIAAYYDKLADGMTMAEAVAAVTRNNVHYFMLKKIVGVTG